MPTTLPCSVVCYPPVQVRPIAVMREVSIDSLQQQVRTFWGEYLEVRVFLWGGGIPPHASDLNWGPPWGLTVLLLLIICPIGLLLLCGTFGLCAGRLALPAPDATSAGGGDGLWVFLSFPFLPPPSPPLPRPVAAPPSASSSSPGPSGLGLLRKSWGLATMWAAPRRFEN